jgi:hypothetical protein
LPGFAALAGFAALPGFAALAGFAALPGLDFAGAGTARAPVCLLFFPLWVAFAADLPGFFF